MDGVDCPDLPAVVMIVVVVMAGCLELLSAPRAIDHPSGDAEDDDGGCDLEIRLGRLGVCQRAR